MNTEMLQRIQDVLIRKLNPSFIIVFGSYAKGLTHRGSDIDVAFYCEDSFLTAYEVFLLAQELADLLKIEVDLVNLAAASTVFKAQIYTTGTVIYSIDDNLLKNHQMTALSMYAKLNEEREIVLENIDEANQFMKNDVILNKISMIERYIKRIQEVYANEPTNLKDYTKQDSIILNIQRACESSIDLAMHIVSEKRLGLPQNSRDAFDMLQSHSIIDEGISKRLKAMVGFRNIAVHDYQTINLEILKQIVDSHLGDFTDYTKQILNY